MGEASAGALEEQLYHACKDGDLAKIRILLAAGAEPACRDEDGVTPLMLAAESHCVQAVAALLEAGAPWHDRDKGGHTAAEYGMADRKVLQLLLDWACQAELELGLISGRERTPGVAINHDYLSSTVRYEGGKLMDAAGEAVMMGWEAPLMERHADIICAGGGDILNIGFGMGIIDVAIQRRGPRSHTIIEAHPDVYQHMLEQGWAEKPGVRVVLGRWQDVLHQLGPFDGVFFDTFGEYYEDMRELHAQLPRLLRAEGVYSFFNGLAPDNLFFHLVYGEIARRELNALGLAVRYDAVPVDTSDHDEWAGVRSRYWHLPVYFAPMCVMDAAAPTGAAASREATAVQPKVSVHDSEAAQGSDVRTAGPQAACERTDAEAALRS